MVSSTQKPLQYFFFNPFLPSAHLKLLLADACQVLEVSVALWGCLRRACSLCAVLQRTQMSSKPPYLLIMALNLYVVHILECGFLPPGSFFETALLETVKIKKLLAVIWIRNIRLLCLNTWSLVGVGRLWNLKEMYAPLLEELCLWGDLWGFIALIHFLFSLSSLSFMLIHKM